MIVKMSKYAYLVYHKEYDTFLERLRSLGVVHVEQSKPTDEHAVIQGLIAENKRVVTQLDFLDSLLKAEIIEIEAKEKLLKAAAKGKNDSSAIGAEKDVVSAKNAGTDAKDVVASADSGAITTPAELLTYEESEALISKIENMRENIGKIQSSILLLEKERDSISVWGDFKYSRIKNLRDAGYEVSFFTSPQSRFDDKWETDYNAFVINNVQSVLHFITITPTGKSLSIEADRARIPLNDYGQISENIEAETNKKKALEAELLEIAHKDYASIKNLKTKIENDTAWNNVLAQTNHEADDKLMFIEGWIPERQAAEMEDTISKEGYYCSKMEITDEDEVPIKLRNSWFSNLFEPITNLYSLPNYKEFDPTPLFAPFFMLFFGLCLGDGGYGLLLMVISLVLRRKASESMKSVLSLIMVLGAMTFVIGILTGSFFGVSIGDFAILSSVKEYFLTSENLMTISLIIGFFHVIYAKVVAAMKLKVQRGFKYSISSFAWVFLLLSLFCVFALPMLEVTLPLNVEYALYGVAAFFGVIALFYNSPGKNIVVNFGSGLWTTYNNVTGLLGDVLSYIRLYAIGLTGGLLGGVFNSMAVDMTSSMSPFIRWLPMLLILLLGHGLNIGLGMISSLVHPLRLVFVEYYKNSEFEGGGITYNPFKKI